MAIGELNKYIDIQAPTKISDGAGGYVNSYIAICSVWAAINPLSAKRKEDAKQSGISATHEIKIRYRVPFKSTWRVKFGNRYFSIAGIINPKEKNEYLSLNALEVGS